MGGTMRLGLRPTVFESSCEKWSKVKKLYGGAEKIWERHRHRYEVNPDYIEKLTASGMTFIGRDERGERMQILELQGSLNATLPNIGLTELIAIVQIIHISLVFKLILSSAPGRLIHHRLSSVLSRLPLLQNYFKNKSIYK
jgi:hypothetical protein